jgi:hypothetical protein
MQPRLDADIHNLPVMVKPQAVKGRVGILLLRSYLFYFQKIQKQKI